jgi:hypothetical protein
LSSFKERFAKTKPRETVGSDTASRFDYQKNWALCEILRRHETNDDYCVFLEHHEDVVVLDSSNDPLHADFYQIKTKRAKHWLLSALIEATDGKDHVALCIIGKLFESAREFQKETRSLSIVSNAPFQVELKDQEGQSETSLQLEEIPASVLSDKDKKKIFTRLQHEGLLGDAADYENVLFLRVSALSLRDHDRHTLGHLVDFLERKYPGRRIDHQTLHRTLFAEIRERTNHCVPCSDTEDLFKKKSIDRKTFQLMLDEAGVAHDANAMWQAAESQLLRESISPARLMRLKTEWRRHEIDRMNRSDVALAALRSTIRSLMDAWMEDESLDLMTVLDQGFDACMRVHPQDTKLRGRDYINATTLSIYFEAYG